MQNMACNYAQSNQNINTDMKELLQENDWSMKMKLELLLQCWESKPENTPIYTTQMCRLKHNTQLLTRMANFL